jgi:two-component system, LytTR family, response regulator
LRRVRDGETTGYIRNGLRIQIAPIYRAPLESIMERNEVSSRVSCSTGESAATLSALVVDDEAIARDGLGQILSALGDVKVLPGCRNGHDATRVIRASRPDVVFLDVEMPDISGIDVVRSLQSEAAADELPIFVFVTAYSSYAIEAFNLAASDYLVKPFTDARIADCMIRVRRLSARLRAERLSEAVLSLTRSNVTPPPTSALTPRTYVQRLLIPHGMRIVVVPVSTIDWIGAANDYVVVHSLGKAHLLRGTLGAIEHDLDPQCFARAHRSVLVNLDQIVELRRDRDGSAALILRDGVRLPVGRRRYDDIRDSLASRSATRLVSGKDH